MRVTALTDKKFGSPRVFVVEARAQRKTMLKTRVEVCSAFGNRVEPPSIKFSENKRCENFLRRTSAHVKSVDFLVSEHRGTGLSSSVDHTQFTGL